MKLSLPKVTLLVIDCYNVGAALASIKKSTSKVDFGAVKLLTDVEVKFDGIEVIKIPSIKSKNDYSKFILKEAYKYIYTDFVIVAQHDSWILNQDCFDERLYDFDYAGALWLENDGLANGNGGMSWRSHKLMKIIGKDKFINSLLPEDVAICRVYRNYLETNYGLKWATDEICEQFSFELREPTAKTFAFHSFFHEPFKEHVVIKRTGALGDLVMCEPLISYYHNKGYQVVLDTLPEMMGIFYNHPYKIKHISQMNPKIKPIKVINLDMSYESKPKQNVLKTYYEFAGITDGEMRNSRLNVYQNENQKLFQKYILISLHDTGMPHRNSYGVDWEFVVNYLSRLGFLVLQVGAVNPHIAPHFNAETKEMLMYVVKGADLVIGLDSGIAQLSVALDRPTVIMSGSVDLSLRYHNFDKIQVVQGECESEADKHCYHSEIGTTGVKCKYNENNPPCANHSHFSIIAAVNKLLKTE
jgi:hypothetical protein